MVNDERKPIMVSGAEPPAGSRPEPLVRGPWGDAPLKLNAFLRYHNLRCWPMCHKIYFCKTKMFRRTFGGMVPLLSWIPQGALRLVWMDAPVLVAPWDVLLLFIGVFM